MGSLSRSRLSRTRHCRILLLPTRERGVGQQHLSIADAWVVLARDAVSTTQLSRGQNTVGTGGRVQANGRIVRFYGTALQTSGVNMYATASYPPGLFRTKLLISICCLFKGTVCGMRTRRVMEVVMIVATVQMVTTKARTTNS